MCKPEGATGECSVGELVSQGQRKGEGLAGCTSGPPDRAEGTAHSPLPWCPGGLCTHCLCPGRRPRQVGLPGQPPKGPGTTESALFHKERSILSSMQSQEHSHCHTTLVQRVMCAGGFAAAAPSAGIRARALRAWKLAARAGPWAPERPLQTSKGSLLLSGLSFFTHETDTWTRLLTCKLCSWKPCGLTWGLDVNGS